MAAQHHGDPEVMKRFLDQMEGTAQREYPQGRMGGDDEGSLSYAITTDARHRTIVIRFGKPVEWLGLGVQAAIELRDQLTQRIVALKTGEKI